MYKRRRYGGFKRKTYRRRRYFKRSSKRNLQQKQVRAGIRMKYTRVFVPRWVANEDVVSGTISLCAGKTTSIGNCYSITDTNPDGKCIVDMGAYQQFNIYGVSIKWIFPGSQDVVSTPVQFSCAYSPNQLLNPLITPEKLQSLSTFQTMGTTNDKTINRYYSLGYTKKKLGIDYCNTSEYNNFGANSAALYGGQLPASTGPSLHFKVYRAAVDGNYTRDACRMQLTYYVRYRGTKGVTDIT